MGSIFKSPAAPDTSALDKRNAELEKKNKEAETANKAADNRAAARRFGSKGRRSLITTSEEGLPDNLG